VFHDIKYALFFNSSCKTSAQVILDSIVSASLRLREISRSSSAITSPKHSPFGASVYIFLFLCEVIMDHWRKGLVTRWNFLRFKLGSGGISQKVAAARPGWSFWVSKLYARRWQNYTNWESEIKRYIYYTGGLHPKDVAAEVLANTALIDSPAPHIPKGSLRKLIRKLEVITHLDMPLPKILDLVPN